MGMPVLAPERETSALPPAPPDTPAPPVPVAPLKRRGPRRGAARALGAAVVAVLALVGLNRLGDLLPHLANPFRTESVDRTGPVVLKALDDLHEYQAATGSFQVLVDIEQDAA